MDMLQKARQDMPMLLAISFEYTEDGEMIIPTIQYIEQGDIHPHSREVRSLTFSTAIGEHIAEAVDEFQYNLVRLIDAVNEANRVRPASIPSRKFAQDEQREGDDE